MPENTGQLHSFTETCGFSDEIYFKLPKHFQAALMTGQSRDCIGLQFTNRSSFANMKIGLTKELCPVHYNQGASSCCNPCSPGLLNTSQQPLEHCQTMTNIKTSLFLAAVGCLQPICISEPAWECAFICMSLPKQAFSSNKSSVASPEIWH